MTARHSAASLTELAAAILRACGVSPEHADITATRLVEADLRGRSGHGLIRLASYVQPDPCRRPQRATRHQGAARDARVGPGRRRQRARPGGDDPSDRAGDRQGRESGLAWVGTVHSNHAGAAGLYAQMAADAGLIGIYFAVANANGMPPWGGTNPLLGTNPLAIAIPTNDTPFVLDIATTGDVARNHQSVCPRGPSTAGGLGGRCRRKADHGRSARPRGLSVADGWVQGLRPDDRDRPACRRAQRRRLRRRRRRPSPRLADTHQHRPGDSRRAPDLFRPATRSSPTSLITSTRCATRAAATGRACVCPVTKPRRPGPRTRRWESRYRTSSPSNSTTSRASSASTRH